jgi:uncharacterized repeat protein (TIGR01451 family)
MPQLTLPLKTTKRATNLFLAFFLAFWQLALPLIITQTAFAANVASTPVSNGGVTPYIIDGENQGGNRTCSEAGQAFFDNAGYYQFSSARVNYENDSFDAAFPAGLNVTTDGTYISFGSTFGIGAVIVKGSNDANVYIYDPQATSDSGLASPINPSGKPAGLSNLTFCWNPGEQEPEPGSIDIVKDAQPNNTQAFEFTATGDSVSNFTLDDDGDNTNAYSNTKQFTDLASGTYTFTEKSVNDWMLDGIICNEDADVEFVDATVTVNLKAGEHVTCTFVNKKNVVVVNKGKISGLKFHDKNGNGKWNFGEPTLRGWTIFFDLNKNGELDGNEPSTVTNKFGAFVFKNLPNGFYKVCEQQQDGWIQTYPKNNKCHTVKITKFHKSAVVNFGNKKAPIVCEAAVLQLSKSNDKPNPVMTGDVVTYTLIVKLPADSSSLFDVRVYDVIPENFEFVVDSDTATEGSLISPYASLGVWSLGDMQPGDEVTLSYQTLVKDNVTPGIYPDVAYAVGTTSRKCGNEQVLSNLTNENDDPFVGTQVTIVAAEVTPSEIFTGQVLGVATLADTGSGFSAIQFGIPSIMLIVTSLLTRRSGKGDN